jgi:hypothetical protein
VIIGGVDLVNLVGFPLSTILGLYALVVYSHGETVSFFASRRSGKAGASSPR